MSKARVITVFGIVVFLFVLIQSNIASATNFTVGDSQGWSFHMVGWPNGKSFKAGDVLVFSYTSGSHNVVVVDKNSFNSCTTPKDAKVYTSGDDHIKLEKGESFFICNYPGHCEADMKIAVTVT